MSDAAALVRSLLLPLGETNFVDVVAQVSDLFNSWAVDEADRETLVQNLIHDWRTAGSAPARMKQLVAAALDSETSLPAGFSRKYFMALSRLQSDNSLLSFEQGRGLLSNALLVSNLLVREGMSAAQVALVLNASQNTTSLTWRHVQILADALDARPTLDLASVTEVHEMDLLDEPLHYADASPEESMHTLARRANELGYPSNMVDQLDRFLGEDRNFESAFAVILHVNALITQFFDHPLSQAAYEFEPRGSVISETMRSAHPSYQAAESPYLNNAKGTFAFDSNWAWGRKENNRRQAHALVEILNGLGEMAYQPRRELASWVRQWLLRMERARSATFVRVDTVTREGANKAIARICTSNTATQGVLEQRLLDLAVTAQYFSGDGWRFRGIGDAVNASNVSKRKLGDLEAENALQKSVVAFEPHGGKLTEVYVDKHRTSLAQVLGLRLQEFELVAPPEDWSMRVIFIAHDISTLTAFDESILGFTVQYEFETYETFFAGHTWSDETLDSFSLLVADPIDKAWIPDDIKAALNSAMTD